MPSYLEIDFDFTFHAPPVSMVVLTLSPFWFGVLRACVPLYDYTWYSYAVSVLQYCSCVPCLLEFNSWLSKCV